MRVTLALILLVLALSVPTPINAQVQKIRLTGENTNVYYAEWSPDGQLIALAVVRESPAEQPSGVYLITPEGKEVARITENVEADDRLFRMEWSPDSQYIKCTISPYAPIRETVVIASREGKILSHVKHEIPNNVNGWLPDSNAYWEIDDDDRHLLIVGLGGTEVKRFDGILLPYKQVSQSPDLTACHFQIKRQGQKRSSGTSGLPRVSCLANQRRAN